ncbi:N-acetyl sugar amidotransferase [Pseudoalteromonas arabiensis]|uniref:N-acetyl sugar amidotransferase n=1 Tax=Pseudoalteromonas arabiensis TaxID=874454 RepID=UPI000784B1D4|nr:N-acetyl sugar amidotransferase [Pseudoalteromonas arabiensis]|tara:strand:- start:11905 stop:13029 length:1125 start_codon:yes stop_codon:yes gene_type:complete
MKSQKICSKCVLDTTVSDIKFDSLGVCNYCHAYDKVCKTIPNGEMAAKKLEEIVSSIKKDGIGHEYDCIIGLSGGVDSTYLAHLVVSLGLRPLAVHVDTGWNSDIAVQNIEKVVKILKLDLYTVVIDWEEMKDLQLAFFKASVPDCDIPQDHVFPAVLNKIAAEHGIKHSISGHNVVTEYVLPRNWSYDSNDLEHIKDIHKQFGTGKLVKYPTLSLFKRTIYYKFIKPVKSHRLLYYIPYNKDEIKRFIIENLGWKDYGGKHFESRFTKFFQAYFLPTKFGFDKRKAHLSNLIMSDQITRESALNELCKPQYNNRELEEDLDYIISKLDISREEWEQIMALPTKQHNFYKSDFDLTWFKYYKKVALLLKGFLKK